MKTKVHGPRWLIRRDLPEVLAIDEKSFETPWNEAQVLKAMTKKNCIGMVVETKDDACTVVGYMIYELYKTRLELIRFAVHPDYRYKGIARLMMAKLQDKLAGHRRTRVACDVSERNTDAQLCFKALGWQAVRTDRGGGLDGEDNYRFTYTVPAEVTVE